MSLDGIINLHKPLGITSARAVHRVRGIVGFKKSGHAGSLDPAAEGVLIVCQGRATKLVEHVMDLPKTYMATARLDLTSISYDSEGATEEVAVERVPDEAAVREAFAGFVGEIAQVPPRRSAVKLGGTPAYKTMNLENPPEIRPRIVRIDAINVLSFDWPVVRFEMICGRGTYVRSVIRDVGEKLETGGCLTALERPAVGPFTMDEALGLDELRERVANGEPYLMPLDEAKGILSSALGVEIW